MTKILLLSDTHSFLDPAIEAFAQQADEIWHAGDIGSLAVTDQLAAWKPLRAVYGNIDDATVRRTFPLDLEWEIEGLKIWMTHIGGYPGRYNQRVRALLPEKKPGLFICGHSHILKVMPDRKNSLLHMNPGACGQHGFHKLKTMLRFQIVDGLIDQVEAIELGPRGKMT